MINYCLPIIINSKSAVLDTIHNNLDTYQYFEVWLDYIIDVDEPFVADLVKELENKLVLVFRRQNLEDIQMELSRRLALLNIVDKTGAYVDLDIESQKTELEYISQSKLKINIITSFHNYKSTPSTPKLMEIIGTMKAYDPTVYKIAAYCEFENDALRLMELLHDLKHKEYRTIVLGMGKKGVITRVFGTLWGNEMIFAPIDEETTSAPGQLTIKQLQSIYKELGY